MQIQCAKFVLIYIHYRKQEITYFNLLLYLVTMEANSLSSLYLLN